MFKHYILFYFAAIPFNYVTIFKRNLSQSWLCEGMKISNNSKSMFLKCFVSTHTKKVSVISETTGSGWWGMSRRVAGGRCLTPLKPLCCTPLCCCPPAGKLRCPRNRWLIQPKMRRELHHFHLHRPFSFWVLPLRTFLV